MFSTESHFEAESQLFKRQFSRVLDKIRRIYEVKENEREINRIYEKKVYTTWVFQDGEVSRRYTKAKIIDMNGFYRKDYLALVCYFY